MEDYVARDDRPLDACLADVAACELYVGLYAWRYGYVPEDGNPERRSITELEYRHARANGIPCLVFLLDEDVPWKPRFQDAYTGDGEAGRSIRALREELGKERLASFFDSAENLARLVSVAVGNALRDQAEAPTTGASPEKYLRKLRKDTGFIGIRGLGSGSGKAHRSSIEDLYIRLATAGAGIERDKAGGRMAEYPALEAALSNSRLAVVGDPGCGKTTFLNWVAYTLAGDRLGETAGAAGERLGLTRPLLPALVPIADWLEYAELVRAEKAPGPKGKHATAWLPHFLGARAEDNAEGLDAAWFRARLEAGDLMVLLDGLDEAPGRQGRERAVKLIESVAGAWPGCPVVVTSRPGAYPDRAVIADFDLARIEPLDDSAVRTFLGKWSEALHKDDRPAAERHSAELLAALQTPGVRRPAPQPQHRDAHRARGGALECEAPAGAARRTLRADPHLAGALARAPSRPRLARALTGGAARTGARHAGGRGRAQGPGSETLGRRAGGRTV